VGFSITGPSLLRTKSKPKRNSTNHSDLSIIFVQLHNLSALLSLSLKLPTLKTIITLEEIPEAARKIADAWGKERGIRVLTLNEGVFVFGFLHFALGLTGSDSVEAIGVKTPLPPPLVTADTIATICYTSVRVFPVCHFP